MLGHISRSRYYSTSTNSTNSESCMIYPMVPFPVTLSDPEPRFQGHGDALYVLCAQLTRDLFAIAKFLFTLLQFLQTLTNCYNIWRIVYRVNLQHNSYWLLPASLTYCCYTLEKCLPARECVSIPCASHDRTEAWNSDVQSSGLMASE